MKRLGPCLSATLLALSVGLGCDRDRIESYSAPKTPAMPAMTASADVEPAAPSAGAIHWSPPESWKPLPAKEMRFASFAVDPAYPEVELTVVPLGGEGGSLLANVNRWESQLGLPPTPEAQLPGIVHPLQVGDLSGWEVELSAPAADGKPARRTLGAILQHADQTWFFKLTGPTDVVAAQKANFDQFVGSVRFDPDSSSPPPSAAATPDNSESPIPLAYQLPPGWIDEHKSNEFRLASFQVKEGDTAAEATISATPRDAGTVLDNVNRWRGQVGLPAVADLASIPVESIKVSGEDAQAWDLSGASQRMIVVLAPHGPQWWFFKFNGPTQVIDKHKADFFAFMASVRFQQ